ncbi:MAG: hypothetical protein OWR52_10215 [Acidibacillus sp.]|nr:hypothetical protein [Acidibacillus sp.]
MNRVSTVSWMDQKQPIEFITTMQRREEEVWIHASDELINTYPLPIGKVLKVDVRNQQSFKMVRFDGCVLGIAEEEGQKYIRLGFCTSEKELDEYRIHWIDVELDVKIERVHGDVDEFWMENLSTGGFGIGTGFDGFDMNERVRGSFEGVEFIGQVVRIEKDECDRTIRHIGIRFIECDRQRVLAILKQWE